MVPANGHNFVTEEKLRQSVQQQDSITSLIVPVSACFNSIVVRLSDTSYFGWGGRGTAPLSYVTLDW